MENILKFLDIGKADFDRIKYGLGNNGIKGAAIINLNKSANIPMEISKKKNKNDFYRFLLAQSNKHSSDFRINNDVLIPRSILKKCGEKQKRS